MQRQKIHSQLQNTRNVLVFTFVLATERPNIFRVAAGTHHWIVKKTRNYRKQKQNKENNSPTAQAAIFVCAFQIFFFPYQDSK